MAGPALAIGFILLIAFILSLLILFYIMIKKRKQLVISVPLAAFFVCLLIAAVFVYRAREVQQYKDAREFLGDYTLSELDGQYCQQCLVRLNSNFQYDILQDGQIVGHGKWWLESAIDIPGKYLQIENGPIGVIWAHQRTIDYINR